MDQPVLTAEIAAVLARYVEIQAEERKIEQEKHSLQRRLASHLKGFRGRYWFTEVGNRRLRITYNESLKVEYEEEALRQRLGDRYNEILSIDWTKLKGRADLIETLLHPHLSEIGSPDREKIRSAIAEGRFTVEDFRGTFTKSGKPFVAVAVVSEPTTGTRPAAVE
ncbi:MAG: hypothetical protein EHM61_14145 [Acidobacteria bacterium]|nr:MAG: hypothetical protein EHM61_14145 [Acidobacteriota bacterium]